MEVAGLQPGLRTHCPARGEELPAPLQASESSSLAAALHPGSMLGLAREAGRRGLPWGGAPARLQSLLTCFHAAPVGAWVRACAMCANAPVGAWVRACAMCAMRPSARARCTLTCFRNARACQRVRGCAMQCHGRNAAVGASMLVPGVTPCRNGVRGVVFMVLMRCALKTPAH